MTEPSLIRYLLRKKCKAPPEEWSRSGRDGHVLGADIGSIVTLPYCPCWREVMKTLATHQLQFIVPVFCLFFIHFASYKEGHTWKESQIVRGQIFNSFASERKIAAGATLV